MLEITIPGSEDFDEVTNEFKSVKGGKLYLEHSLRSISAWEAKFKKPYLSDKQKTTAESIYYVKCMTINKKEVDDSLYLRLTFEDFKKINDYCEDPMTATTITDRSNKKPGKSIITSEEIYWQMSQYNLDPEFYEKWHFNRLVTLLRICSIRSNPNDKMSKKDILAQNRALNAARRRKHGTRG